MTPFFPSEFVSARTTPCITRSAAEGVSVAMHEFGGSDNAEGKLLVQMLTSIGARMIMKSATDEEAQPDALEFSRLAKATKDLIGAAKTDSERDAKIREEAAKEARRQAAEAAEDEARSAGASEATIMRVKSRILGLAA